MATFGLKMYKADGVTVAYDSSSITWNQVDQLYVAGNSSGSWNYPLLIGKEVLIIQLLINTPSIARKCIAHVINSTTASTNGNISISGGSENAFFLVLIR